MAVIDLKLGYRALWNQTWPLEMAAKYFRATLQENPEAWETFGERYAERIDDAAVGRGDRAEVIRILEELRAAAAMHECKILL